MSRTSHHGRNQKKRTFGSSYWWMQNYPKWWDHIFHTKPRRAKERQALDRVKRDLYNGENELFPLDHKPHEYYW